MKADLSAVNGPIFDKFLKYVRYTICGVEEDHLRHIILVSYSLFCSVTILVNLCTFYYYIYDFDKLAVILHHTIIIYNIWMVAVIFHRKKGKLMYLLNCMNKSFDYGDEKVDLFVDSMFRKREPLMKLMYRILTLVPFSVYLNLNLFAFLERYYWKTDVYFVAFPVFPSPQMENWTGYVLLTLWQQGVLFVAIYVLFTLISILYLIYNHIVGEFAVLDHALSTINERIQINIQASKDPTSNERFNEISTECTKQCAKYHTEIIRYFDAANECFMFVYLLVVVSGIFLLVSAGYASISDNTPLKARFTVVLGTEFVYIYGFCWIGEDIAGKSEDVGLTVYDLEWWNLPKSSHSILRLIMTRTMKPLYFKTLTGQTISLTSYMDCVKGAYSYFNFLLTTKDT